LATVLPWPFRVPKRHPTPKSELVLMPFGTQPAFGIPPAA